MERSRESKRVARRLRISCPKDLTSRPPVDVEAQMDDTPLIEKVKKGNLQALRASFPLSASKRKRNEAHKPSEDFPESTPSDMYDDDAPQGAINSKQRAKKDELVMNCNIPRRARSSATRVPSVASSRQLVPKSLQRSPSPGILPTKEEKLRQIGVKSRLLKDLEVTENEQISDQEVEIAGLLYDLSRSLPTVVQSTSTKSEEKCRRDLEEEEFSSSIAGLERLSRSCGPLLHERKCKRLRVLEKQEESPCMPPAERVNANTGFCVGELPILVEESIQVDESLCKRGAASKLSYQQPEIMPRDMIKEPCLEDDMNKSYTEEERGQKASEDNLTHFTAQTCKQDSLESASLLINKSELCGQAFSKDSNYLKTSSRSDKGLESNGMSSSKAMWSLRENRTANNEKVIQGKLGEAAVKDDCRLGITDVPRWNQGLSKAPLKGEQETLRLLDVKNHITVMPDLCRNQETLSGISLVSTIHPSSSNATTSNDWMGAFPEVGLNKKAGPSWLTNCIHAGSSSCQTMQLPHAASAQHFVQRIRRCATHVHIAHFIQQQQQFLRRPFWPTACNPRNLSLSSASLQEKECSSNKTPSLQAERRDTWSENVGTRISTSRGYRTKNKNFLARYDNSAQVLFAGAGMKKGCGDLKSMRITSHPKQSASHTSGPNTISLSLNSSPAQNVSFCNKGLYSVHQNHAQQGAALLECQQGSPASLHISSSQSHSTQPKVQLQVQCEQVKQPHSRLTPPPQLCGAGSGAFLEGKLAY